MKDIRGDVDGVSFVTNAKMSAKRELYPNIEPYNTGMLRVSDVHEIYYEQSGNPDGKPVVFVHGGPGGGTSGKQRRFFDPVKYRIVLFDQRGAGKSTPHACLDENTTWDLVSDMEKIRQHLEIEAWQVFGGSWGSTLSLTYAIKHPERVTELVLRGIFLLRRSEIEWFYQEGAHNIFPDAWEKYLEPIPAAEWGDLVGAYYRRLTGHCAAEKMACAKAWSIWEGTTCLLQPSEKHQEEVGEDAFAEAFARIECHYFAHGGFFPRDGWILEKEQLDRIRHIPTVIVQGRYDVVCPMRTAWDLHRKLPEAEFHVIQDSGHSADEPGIAAMLMNATDKFAQA